MHAKALRCQKVREPAAHLAAAPDHQGALAAALRLSGNPRLFLGGERGLDQLAQQRFRQIRRDPETRRGAAAAQDHLPLARKVPGRTAGGALDRRDLLGKRLASGDDLHEFTVECGERDSQFVEIHGGRIPPGRGLPILLLAAPRNRKHAAPPR